MRKLLFVAAILAIVQTVAAVEPSFVLKTPSGDMAVIKFKNYFYVSFDLIKPAEIALTSGVAVKSVEISPKSYHIPFNLKDNVINIKLEKSEYVMVRINDTIKVFLFAEKPEAVPTGNQVVNIITKYQIDPTGQTNETAKIQQAINEISGTGKTLYFPSGIYKSGQLQIRSNSKIYLGRGALLNADTSSVSSFNPTDGIKTKRFIYMNNVENVNISGYGTINGNGRILRNKYGDEARMRILLAVRSKNVVIDGLMFQDPGSWNTHVLDCEDIVLRNIKLLNDIDLSNTDGFDPDATKRMLIENCFAYCSDDNVAIKTTGTSNLLDNVDNITVKGCVFLTKKSSLKVGTETRGEIMKNITFENNDVIECDRGMAIYVSDGALLDSISFINNRFERNHPDQQRKAIHFVVSRRNPDSKLGRVKYVLIKDCNFESEFPRKSVIKYEGDIPGIAVTINNLVIAGEKVNSIESAGIEATNSIIDFK